MATEPSDLAALWRTCVGRNGPRPFLTFHDFGTGERVELSYATMDNWTSKTANLIQDELLADPGSRFLLAAPPHWMTAVWAIAPLLCSAVVSPWGDAARARYAVAGPEEEQLEYARACRGERYALSLLPLGRPFAEVPEGFADYVVEVRVHGDRFAAFDPPNADAPALTTQSGEALTHREVLEKAAGRVEAGARLLIPVEQTSADAEGLIDWLYAPMAAGGSVVLARGGDAEQLARLAEVEKAQLVSVER
ncbi:TIGR03089 family protein [Actinospica sp. MGRD01-02]|uniref:TIGR03089 family protein n=1 Tax=Actinospica acidithermotolerans TaxID=2828514 RepID=A0A941EGF6_9ACTN|nr:TIGR03089 family protein [Actinospica acidithermotolerans]MBR7829938.1 TIGR03089 family protein [Actinospica acidithermotolerans]